MKNKKGEITTNQLVMIIILIVSFVVILFLLFRLNLGEESDKEICYNSVVLKSKSASLAGSLNCKTNYLCISRGGKCEGINPTTTVSVDSKNKEEIMKAIADEMADCWWMFGEGKLNYLGLREKGILEKATCAICSVIKFDEEILRENYQISYREFYEYLNTIKKSESQTFLTYLYNSYNPDDLGGETTSFIIGEDRYAIVTGIKSGIAWGFGGDIFIRPQYIRTSEIASGLGCEEFVTKS